MCVRVCILCVCVRACICKHTLTLIFRHCSTYCNSGTWFNNQRQKLVRQGIRNSNSKTVFAQKLWMPQETPVPICLSFPELTPLLTDYRALHVSNWVGTPGYLVETAKKTRFPLLSCHPSFYHESFKSLQTKSDDSLFPGTPPTI